MTKKILPTMIGVALAGGMTAAAADVTVFGHIDTSIVNYDVDIGSSNADDTNFVCTTCSIGFKGSEDLGNGLKAIFSLDFQYDTTERNNGRRTTVSTSTKQFTTKSGASTKHVTSVSTSSSGGEAIIDRDQWLGLAGGFGQVRIGTISTVYKSHGAMIDPLYRTVAQARDHGLQSFLHSGAGEEGQGRATNTVRWDSADFSGLKIGAHYTLDSSESDGEDNNPYGIGASYENGGILAFVDYITNDGDSGDELDAWKVGGKFSMDAFSVFGQYEDIEVDGSVDDLVELLTGEDPDFSSASANLDGDIWHLGGTYGIGSNTLYAAYGQGDADISGEGNFDYDTWTIGAIHSMSKRTSIYGAYNNLDVDDGDIESDVFAIGMKHKF